ncbi:MAG: c-type cytochrome domain-containing protein, partial [Planctomycetota bacterium]|nr:c-type cytochrome domain-containing protein [Planctomycetota bacterium]
MNFRNLYLLTATLVLQVCFLQAADPGAPLQKRIDFNRDIRPILSNNCYPCHGPDENKRKADLRLDLKSGLYDDHDGERPVVGGKPAQSELYNRIIAKKAGDRMPPPKSKLQLKKSEIELIR